MSCLFTCPCQLCSHARLLSFTASPSCTLQTKVALCAAGPTYAPCMKPQGQPCVCKSVWHSKTYHSSSAHAHCLSLLTHSSLPWHNAVTFTSCLTPVASSSFSTTHFLTSLCAVVSCAMHKYLSYHKYIIITACTIRYVLIWNCLWCLLFIDHHSQKG